MFEFVEIYNDSSTASINLTSVTLSDSSGIIFTFPFGHTLAPLERLLIVSNQAAFTARYGNGMNIAGQFIAGAKLSNSGEEIKLDDASNSTIISFNYKDGDNDSWPGRADGKGSTLQIINSNLDPQLSENWQSSRTFQGTPGKANQSVTSAVQINEVLTHTDDPREDQIELFNPTDTAIDIGGWYLSDSNNNYKAFRIPNGTIIPAYGFIVFNESDFNAGNTPNGFNPDAEAFGLNGAHGETIYG